MLWALELTTNRREYHNKILTFHIIFFPYFSHGKISTVGFKGSRFEFHR